ncbi:MAG: extracellular solute-binding protein family 1 [Clostridia bacterium]|nr:extracellular solute-binding protein family 1 [Clostridia bacterium]
MKYIKKIAISVIGLLLAIIFISCSSNENDVNNVNTDNTNETKNEPKTYKDMGGTEFIIATAWMNQFFPLVAQTEWGDRILERYAEVEENYNCVIKPMEIVYDKMSTFLSEAMAIGEDIPEIFDTHANVAYNYYKAGMLMPYEDLETIDINDDKWGPLQFRKYCIFDGKSYGFFTYDWETMPEVAGTLLLNMELMKKRGISENPYEMQEKGEWTWDNFYNLVEKCTFKEDEIYGLGIAHGLETFITAAIFSNNGEFVKQNSEGKYYFSLTDSEALEAMEWTAKLNGSGFVKALEGPDFVDEKCTILACESWVATHTDDWMGGKYPAANMNDIASVLYPTGPKAATDRVSAYLHMNRREWFMPAYSENNKDDWGMVMNDIFEPLEGSDKQAWRDMASRQMYFYDEGYENYIHAIEGVQYDYSTQLNEVWGKITGSMLSIYNGTKTSSQAMGEITEAVNTVIEKELNK